MVREDSREDIDEFGEEIYAIMKYPTRKEAQQYLGLESVKLMLHPGKNNALQSALQALIGLKQFKKYFMMREYSIDEKPD